MELNEVLGVAIKGGASDIHLKAGLPPMFRINGQLVPLKDGPRISPEEMSRMALSIMNNFQRERFKQFNELDLAYGVPGLGRFRVNVFQQRGTVGIVLRVIPFKVRTLDDLNLPPILKTIALDERGLILVTGTTGSGKSTTLAAMIDHINTNETVHVMTVEDPIEFLIRDKTFGGEPTGGRGRHHELQPGAEVSFAAGPRRDPGR
jgi:twitching motility protein PilT